MKRYTFRTDPDDGEKAIDFSVEASSFTYAIEKAQAINSGKLTRVYPARELALSYADILKEELLYMVETDVDIDVIAKRKNDLSFITDIIKLMKEEGNG